MGVNKIVVNTESGEETLIDLTEDTVKPETLLEGDTAHDKTGEPIIGTMKNNGAVNKSITTKDQKIGIDKGFHNGSGAVEIAEAERSKVVPENIRENVTILGVTGSMSGSEGMKPQAKEVTPSASEQAVLPDSGYNCLSQVTVKPIPYVESVNSAGGITVTIG